MDKKKQKEELINLLLKIVVFGLTFVILGVFVFGITIVNDNNMFPRVSEGDLFIYYRINRDYAPGDIVITEFNSVSTVGRVVAKGGDEVNISEDGHLLINGLPFNQEIFYKVTPSKKGSVSYPLKIEEGSYFLLSDYCPDTEKDSRCFGAVKKEDIRGKAITILRRRCF